MKIRTRVKKPRPPVGLRRRAGRYLKAIVMSGHAGHPVLANYVGHGFTAALAQPFATAQRREVLAQVMGRGPGNSPPP
jgi:hypothetical protein